MKNGNQPAMPLALPQEVLIVLTKVDSSFDIKGMTKREMMAMHICAGMGGIDATRQTIAELAVEQADALLAALEKSQ